MTDAAWGQALARTRKAAFGRLATIFGATELDPTFWEDLEAGLIQADLGVELTAEMVEKLRMYARSIGATTAGEIMSELNAQLAARLSVRPLNLGAKPAVILFVGVNGSGKTTSAARLASMLTHDNHTLMLAAADTYRAAAREQLQLWGDRLGVEVIHGEPGSDPGAVVYEACQTAGARGVDALLIDTSGRMHTEHNLMEELKKLVRVAAKVLPGAPHEILLVLDATTGQNGIQQARAFAEAVPLSGVILAKLDSSAKGGVGVAIQQILHLPILYAGIGEGQDDMQVFDPGAYTSSLLHVSKQANQQERG
ncbi:MAG: signal recognition particle-docking protein FtsY [Anaerolineales bacterium]|nr:signal recognition particle-docking protein FtsY [Anaerolineales bacterium]